ncbi:MAG: hypothetical protein JO053_01200 [Acidobacteria bacterium]|nr:hypothetical protein [Acidobacteriota bacterium]
MFKSTFCLSLLTISLFSAISIAQVRPLDVRSSGTSIFPLSEIKEGMTGTARTVFSGDKPEEFSVEILGVLPGWIGPKQDVIVGRLHGANAERTFVFAGMSGSPVYIDGKLVGAISYSFPFAKEPICGITPFEQMESIMSSPAPNKMSAKSPASVSFADLGADIYRPSLSAIPVSSVASGFASNSMLAAVAGQTFRPIAMPMAFGGVSQQVLDQFAPQLMQAGLIPVATAGSGGARTPMKKATDTTLLGGDSVVVALARGDIQISAAGTVTLREGDKIYAFGHPYYGLGSTDLPMSESHVVTVVPNANNSFKLAVADSTVGTMTQDRATAIYGRLGREPKMLPVKITLSTSRGKMIEYNFESAIDGILTPIIVNVGIANALSSQERSLGESTVEINGEISVKGEQPVKISRRFAGPQAPIFAASSAAIPLSALLKADFEGAEITGVNINVRSVDGAKTAVLDRIAVDRTQAHAGDTIELTAYERTEGGLIITQKVPVTIPKDTAPGALTILIGDGASAQQNSAITQFVPQNAGELIATINKLKRSDKLYAVVSRTSTGAVIGASELPNLPPSVMATINNDRTAGGSRSIVQTVIAEQELAPGEYIVSGSQSLSIEIVR